VQTTPTAQSVTDIAIEKEFLYWTNNLGMNRFGSVHKAFTEPFRGKAQPFETFEVFGVVNSHAVNANDELLFFTGHSFDLSDETQSTFYNELYI
jgi:hypothetical protein